LIIPLGAKLAVERLRVAVGARRETEASDSRGCRARLVT